MKLSEYLALLQGKIISNLLARTGLEQKVVTFCADYGEFWLDQQMAALAAARLEAETDA